MRSVLLLATLLLTRYLAAQNVGVGTTAPNQDAQLHLDVGASITKGLLVTGPNTNFGPITVPSLGAGSRLMYYPAKRVFRAGAVLSDRWDNANVGYGSVALGFNILASGPYSTGFGYATISSGNSSFAAGEQCEATNEGATAIGFYAKANGFGSTAIGTVCTANGYGSIAFGAGAVADGRYAGTIGRATLSRSASGLSVGFYNDPLLSVVENTETPAATSPMFIVGNGELNARSNAFVVRKDGNVAVGNFQPEHRLDVGGRMRLRGDGTANGTAGIWLNDVQNTGIEGFIGTYDNMNVGIWGQQSLWTFLVNTTSGNAWLKGTLTQASDARLKQRITPLTGSMQHLQHLTGYHYNWKPEANADASLQTGLLAQEVQAVFPELVQTNDKGLLSVNYTGLIPHLLEAAKEQQRSINALQAENADLKARLNRLEKLLLDKQQ